MLPPDPSSGSTPAGDQTPKTPAAGTGVGIFKTDRAGRYHFVDQRWHEIVGLPPQAASDDGWLQIVHPEDRDLVSKTWSASVQQCTVFNLEYRLRAAGDRIVRVIGRASAEYDPSGAHTGFAGTVEDVTELRHVQAQHREALDRIAELQSAIDQHAIVAITDLAGRITYANEKFVELSGYSTEELLGQNHRLLKSGEHPPAFYDQLWRTVSSGRVWHGEICNRAKAGHRYWVATTIVPTLGENGRPLRYTSIRTDISERKSIEFALQAERDEHRLIFERAAIGQAAFSLDRYFLDANPALLRMLGFTLDQLRTKTFQDLTHPDDRTRSDQLHAQLRQGEIPVLRAEKRYRRADGSYVWCRVNAVLLRTADGQPVKTLCQFEDIQALKDAAEEKSRIDHKLAEAAKLESLGVLAGGIAHDFNNILTGVLGNASLLRLDLPADHPSIETIGQIELSARRAADLCRQMLAYSGRGRFMLTKVDLNCLIEETTRLIEVSISKNCVLRYHLADNLPAVDADVSQLRQVIMNLVINASEAIGNRSGVIALTTSVVRIDRDYLSTLQLAEKIQLGDYVSLAVADTGCGMAPATLKRIFDPFFTTKFTGRGLGLAAVQGIIRGHHGGLKVYSEIGKGTTFRILLPCAEASAEDTGDTAVATAPWKGHGHALVVDDDESVRNVAARLLERAGFTTELASDGTVGVERFRADPTRFDLVLLDLTMPHMDGEEAFRQMRHILPGVRVILMSGFNHQEVATRFAGKGLGGFVQKPLEAQLLIDEVRRVLLLT